MTIELPRETRAAAIQSIERYFDEELQQRIGNIQAGALLNFFLEEIAPSVYNAAIADAQERLQARVIELDIDCHEDEFGHWKARPRTPPPLTRRSQAKESPPEGRAERTARFARSAAARGVAASGCLRCVTCELCHAWRRAAVKQLTLLLIGRCPNVRR